MAVITISRELAALGDEIARELSARLGYRFVDRGAIEECIKAHGVSAQKLAKYDERKPSFLASLSEDRDDYLHYLKSAILDNTADGNCVVIGRGAFAVLAGVPGVLPVRLVSSAPVRVERVKSYFRCDERRAKQIIARSDNDRAGFHRYFFDIDWRNPANYDLTLNTALLSPAVCAEVIKGLLACSSSADTEERFRERMRDMALSQRVIHHVLYERLIPVHFLEASVSREGVSLAGVAPSASIADAALAAAREVPGAEAARSDIQVVHEYSVVP